jgi:hypothetical protein
MNIAKTIKQEIEGTEHTFRIAEHENGKFSCVCLTNNSKEFSMAKTSDKALEKYIASNF